MSTATLNRPTTRTNKYPTQNKEQKQINYVELLQEATQGEGSLKEGYFAFHNFSLMNRLLACMQLRMMGLPITPIKTFNQWNEIGRRVNKGAKALELCMPYIKKYTTTNDKGEEEQKQYTKFTFKKYWFPMCMTSGEDFTPEIIQWDKEKALKELNIVLVNFECINGNVQGYAKIEENQISINPLNKHYYSTLFHELAHKILHCNNTCTLSHEVKEVEAEAVAMLVNATLELDNEVKFNKGYIQHYIGHGEIDEKSAQRIISATDKILKAGTK